MGVALHILLLDLLLLGHNGLAATDSLTQDNDQCNLVRGPPPDENNVLFNLYTVKNRQTPQRLILGDRRSIENSNFDPSSPVIFYSHGFRDRAQGDGSQMVKDEYIKNSNFYNVVLVDWCQLAKPFKKEQNGNNVSKSSDPFSGCDPPEDIICPDDDKHSNVSKTAWFYYTAACNVIPVGEYVADMINFLVTMGYADLDKIHVIGHSLGAHLSGVIGHNVNIFHGTKLGRITGLDPALPLFKNAILPERLDPGDATFVDIIHTAGGETQFTCLSYGFLTPLGHVDFYPNKGKPGQPGCGSSWFPWHDAICSHSRAYQFYAESINTPFAFPACRCDTYDDCIAEEDCQFPVYMGLFAVPMISNPLENLFYVKTEGSKPFGTDKCPGMNLLYINNHIPTYTNNTNQHENPVQILSIYSGYREMLTAIQVMDTTPSRPVPHVSISYLDEINGPNNVENLHRRNFKRHTCPSGQLYRQVDCRETFQTTWEQWYDYGLNVFDRGHLTPSRPYVFDPTNNAMDSTCLCTNIAPQDLYTNRFPWCAVEKTVRLRSLNFPGYVMTGTCPTDWGYTGDNDSVPDCFWKLYCYKESTAVTKVVGFIAENSLIAETDAEGKRIRSEETKQVRSQGDVISRAGPQIILNSWWLIWGVPEYRYALLNGHPTDIRSYPNGIPEAADCAAAMDVTDSDRTYWANYITQASVRSDPDEFDDECEYCDEGHDCDTDNTQEPCADGSDVVFSVVRQIFNSEIFEADYQYIYRLAYVLNSFGTDGSTCRIGDNGGIWQITDDWYQETKSQIPSQLRQSIINKFQIDWHRTSWQDLRKPLYSALAARILMKIRNYNMQPTIRNQASMIFERIYSGRLADEFIDETNHYYSTDHARGRYDMITMLDGSGSIIKANFEKAKSAVAELNAPFANTQVRVGFILFSTTVTNVFPLNNQLTANQIRNRIQSLEYPDGMTETALAIYSSLAMYQDNEVEPKLPSVSVLLTDGLSNDPGATQVASNLAKSRGIYTFAVGIGGEISQQELLTIAGGNQRHVFHIDGDDAFDALKEIPLWLNVETQTIPLVRPDNDTFQDDVELNEKRYFKYNLPPEGITIEILPTSGSTRAYYSYTFDAPSSAVHNGRIREGLVYIPFPAAKSNTSGFVYVSVEGKGEENRYVIETHSGRFEGCGFVGSRETEFEIEVFESTPVNQDIFYRQLYTEVGKFKMETLERDYLQQIVEDGVFKLITKERFSSYIKEKHRTTMNSSISFSCADGTVKRYSFKIEIIDENDCTPQIEPTTTEYTVVLPLDLALPINPHPILAYDVDFEEYHAQIYATTNDSLIQVVADPIFSSPYPAVYEYNLSMFFKTQPPIGLRGVLLSAFDGKQQGSANITINVV